ncbi:LCP family protein [Spirochaeta africana]|uniref:Transcriptional regulator n=1 Tax=Spirochaeta africana (strain ATCC 700263 / DSM 8902 / Z-7692) TaxID=889378 RepID=H9UK91_SPIAZ|nr:LCP family protein [Spirochaeta africana]AFG37934.1 transcriptional regulator [Spirochaeta africana DSM 8902]
MQRTGSSTVIVAILIAIIVIVLGTVTIFLVQQTRVDPVSARIRDGEPLALLTVLHDEGRLVSTQVVFAHPNSRRIGMLDIPDDMGAIISRLNRVDRIGSLFELEGIGPYRSKISEQIGVDIDYHLKIDLDQLSELVDILGGLTVFIPDPVRDTESSILLPGGNVRLDGPKLVDYLIYERELLTPQELMARNQEIAAQLLFSMGRERRIFEQQPGAVLRRMQTDLDRREMASIIGMLYDADTDNMIQQRVLGTMRTVDIQGETRQLLFPHFEGDLLKDTVRQVVQTLSQGDPVARGEVVRIELLNGTRRSGLAARTQELFEGYGFQVISVGNADTSDYAQTLVYDRQGSMEKAQSVADVIDAQLIETRPDYETDVVTDVTVILGADFDGWKVRN